MAARVVRSVVAVVVAPVVALSVFGLVLALAWLPAFPDSSGYRLATAYAAAALALAAGGSVAGLVARRRCAVHGIAFVLLFGTPSLVYILGYDLLVLVHLIAAVALAGVGAWAVGLGSARGDWRRTPAH